MKLATPPDVSKTHSTAWTKERPTEPGLYWIRYDEDRKSEDVVCVEPGMRVAHFYEDDETGPQPLDSEQFDGARWAGPLIAPR